MEKLDQELVDINDRFNESILEFEPTNVNISQILEEIKEFENYNNDIIRTPTPINFENNRLNEKHISRKNKNLTFEQILSKIPKIENENIRDRLHIISPTLVDTSYDNSKNCEPSPTSSITSIFNENLNFDDIIEEIKDIYLTENQIELIDKITKECNQHFLLSYKLSQFQTIDTNSKKINKDTQKMISLLYGINFEKDDNIIISYNFNNQIKYNFINSENSITIKDIDIYKNISSFIMCIIYNILSNNNYELRDTIMVNNTSYFLDSISKEYEIVYDIIYLIFKRCKIFDVSYKRNHPDPNMRRISSCINIEATPQMLEMKHVCNFKYLISVKLLHCVCINFIQDTSKDKNYKIDNFLKFIDFINSPIIFILTNFTCEI